MRSVGDNYKSNFHANNKESPLIFHANSYRLYIKLGTPCSGGYSLGSPNYLYRSLSSRTLRFLDT